MEADNLVRKQYAGLLRQIVSSPCFEIWYLLHYEYTTAQYSRSSEVIEKLKSNISDYSKGKTNMYELLKKDQIKACQNAKKLMEYCKDRGAKIHTTDFMPSTEFYIVLECIDNMLQKR